MHTSHDGTQNVTGTLWLCYFSFTRTRMCIKVIVVLFTHTSVYGPSVCLLSVCFCLFVYLPVCLWVSAVCLSVCIGRLSVSAGYLSVSRSATCRSVRVCLSVGRCGVRLSASLSVCLSVCLCSLNIKAMILVKVTCSIVIFKSLSP